MKAPSIVLFASLLTLCTTHPAPAAMTEYSTTNRLIAVTNVSATAEVRPIAAYILFTSPSTGTVSISRVTKGVAFPLARHSFTNAAALTWLAPADYPIRRGEAFAVSSTVARFKLQLEARQEGPAVERTSAPEWIEDGSPALSGGTSISLTPTNLVAKLIEDATQSFPTLVPATVNAQQLVHGYNYPMPWWSAGGSTTLNVDFPTNGITSDTVWGDGIGDELLIYDPQTDTSITAHLGPDRTWVDDDGIEQSAQINDRTLWFYRCDTNETTTPVALPVGDAYSNLLASAEVDLEPARAVLDGPHTAVLRALAQLALSTNGTSAQYPGARWPFMPTAVTPTNLIPAHPGDIIMRDNAGLNWGLYWPTIDASFRYNPTDKWKFGNDGKSHPVDWDDHGHNNWCLGSTGVGGWTAVPFPTMTKVNGLSGPVTGPFNITGRSNCTTTVAGTNIFIDVSSDWVTAPSATNSTGIPGQRAYNATNLFICVDTNSWKRTTIAGW